MKKFDCICGNTLFYDNSLCTSCATEVGWCPRCENIVALLEDGDARRCGNQACGVRLHKCANYALESVCNRCMPAQAWEASSLCDCCSLTGTIPDLSVAGNREKWFRLESAKRRLVYDLRLLKLPVDGALSFDFKADVPGGLWHSMGNNESVLTGHANGKITINIKEADSVEREKLRVDLGESQRTLIGHFRHEIGHYYWALLVENVCVDRFREIFGEHGDASYADALERHYREGPPADWREHYVSAYASMHPWEDFAETFALYLEMVSALDTSKNFAGRGPGVPGADLAMMVAFYQRLGIYLNEMNRGMGLLDVVPGVINAEVMKKLCFVHALVRATPSAALAV